MPKLAETINAWLLTPFGLPVLDVPVAVDTETSGLHPDSGGRVAVVSAAWIPDEILRDEQALQRAVTTGDGVRSVAYPFDQGIRDKTGLPKWAVKRYKPDQLDLFATADPNLGQPEWRCLLAWLYRSGNAGGLIWHGGKFDLLHLGVGTRDWPGKDLELQTRWDTMLAAREAEPLELAALKATAARLWGDDETTAQQTLKPWLGPQTDSRYDLVPWEAMRPYAAKDAELTIRLYWYQQRLVQNGELDPRLVRRKLDVMRVLLAMERRGLPFNSVRCLEAAQRIQARRDEIAAQLPFAPSTNDARRYWFGDTDSGGQGLKPYAVTEKKGEVQLTKDILVKMVQDGIPHAQTYADWQQLDTALSMWYRGYPAKAGSDGRLRMVYRQDGTVSARFSAERVNLQAIPHDYQIARILPEGVPTIRALVEFEAGTEGWEVDLSQAELRVAAAEAGCDPMLELIAADADLHGETARLLFQVEPDHPEWFKYRQVAKRGNFSLIFGSGAETFAAMVERHTGIHLDLPEARKIVSTWNALYPQFQRAIRRYMVRAKRDKYLTLVNGRQRWFRAYDQTHLAFNAYVQGSLAELNQDGMIWTERHYPGALILSVHDSQVLQTRAGEGEQIARHVAAEWGATGTKLFGVPMKADVSVWNGGH
jgi:DNA polymerase I-like protein with 3'-5' exonuclease and polymerase domains